jgi:hypothetical protein
MVPVASEVEQMVVSVMSYRETKSSFCLLTAVIGIGVMTMSWWALLGWLAIRSFASF